MLIDDLEQSGWLNVICPACLCTAGQMCVTAKGRHKGNKRNLPHVARVKKAKLVNVSNGRGIQG